MRTINAFWFIWKVSEEPNDVLRNAKQTQGSKLFRFSWKPFRVNVSPGKLNTVYLLIQSGYNFYLNGKTSR